ncbi:MAG TPA: 3-dehydroquinate synthase, partial [Myxococcales bacterium]
MTKRKTLQRSKDQRVIDIRSRSGAYQVLIGQGAVRDLGQQIHSRKLSRRVAVISDTNVLAHWADAVVVSLKARRIEPTLFALPPGESQKTLASAQKLYGDLIEGGFTRKDAVIALGGGVIGDLAGFVAATYHRGVPLIHVPTSLLAQVDSSIGGKVAVDHRLGKNLVGAFYPPRFVLCDPSVLNTLAERERWSGLAEVVKAALIADRELLKLLEANLEQLAVNPSAPLLLEVIQRSIAIKAKIVSRDELEEGDRVLLNFGHTVGHALEVVTGYRPLTHGEAVVLGMRAAVAVSLRLGRCPAAEASRALG